MVATCDTGLFAITRSDLPTNELSVQCQAMRSRIAGFGSVRPDSAYDVSVNLLSDDEAGRVVLI